MQKQLKVVVWGLGQHAEKNILPALDAVAQISLYGCCSRSLTKVNRLADRWGCRGWTDPDEMLSDSNVDVVYVATPIGIHSIQGSKVLQAGKHLWCEKPLTCNYSDSKMLVELAKKNSLMLAEGFMYLYHPLFNYMKRYITDAKYGAVKTVSCRFGIPDLYRPTFRSDISLGGGAYWDVGSYTISAVLSLFPGVESPGVLYAELLRDPNSQLDLEGRAILRLSDYQTAYLEWGAGCGYRNEVDIWAEQGSIFADKFFSKSPKYEPIVQLRNINGIVSTCNIESSNHFINMFDQFCLMLDDYNLRQIERQNILNRAKLQNEILATARNLNQ